MKSLIVQQIKIAKQKYVFHFCFAHLHQCLLALYTQYFPEFCEQAFYSAGVQPSTFAILKDCHTNYTTEFGVWPVANMAKGILNSLFNR